MVSVSLLGYRAQRRTQGLVVVVFTNLDNHGLFTIGTPHAYAALLSRHRLATGVVDTNENNYPRTSLVYRFSQRSLPSSFMCDILGISI